MKVTPNNLVSTRLRIRQIKTGYHLGWLPKGQQADVLTRQDTARARLGADGEWVEVHYNGITGISSAYYLDEATASGNPAATAISQLPPRGRTWVGLHGPADHEAWAYVDSQPWWGLINQGRIESVLVQVPECPPAAIARLIANVNVKFVVARIQYKFDSPDKYDVPTFIRTVTDSMQALYDAGVRYFQIVNEPNLHTADAPEGMWHAWQNGTEFAEWFLSALWHFRNIVDANGNKRFPEAKFGFPALSPGGTIPEVRTASEPFWQEAMAAGAVDAADWVGLHQYWLGEGQGNAANAVAEACGCYPDKHFIVTEFSNPDDKVPAARKGQQYLEFYAAVNRIPNLYAAISFVAASSGNAFLYERWLGTNIAQTVGERTW